MVHSFIEQCDEDFSIMSEFSSLAVPPIKTIRSKNHDQIRRTVTFNVGALQKQPRINSAVEIRHTKSLGAADFSTHRRVDAVKRPTPTLKAITYSSWLTKDLCAAHKRQFNNLSKRSSPPTYRRAATSPRIVRHRTFQESTGRKSVKSVRLRRNKSAPELKRYAVNYNTETVNSGFQLPSYMSEASSGGRKIRLSSSRMRGKNTQKNGLEMLQEMSQEDISSYNDELYNNEDTAQHKFGNQNGQSDRGQKCCQCQLFKVTNHRRNVLSENETSDTTGIAEISSDSTASFEDHQKERGSWGYRRKSVSRIPTFIQRQEVWRMRRNRYLRKPLAQNTKQYSDNSSSDSDSSHIAEPPIGKNNKEIHRENFDSSEFSTDSTGYGSVSPTAAYLHDWRPPMAIELLHCCGCERCSSVMTSVGSGKHGKAGGCGHLTRPFEKSTFSPSQIQSTHSKVDHCFTDDYFPQLTIRNNLFRIVTNVILFEQIIREENCHLTWLQNL